MQTNFPLLNGISLKTEEQQRKQLKNMKLLALLLLILMCFLLVVARTFQSTYHWLYWLGAFAEAAMIGALADWFAVTAIFRHPLGVPIPHTAIIPKNKNRIAITLGNFIQSNFLNEENISRRIREFNPARHLVQWLSNPKHASKITEEIARSLPEIIKTFNDTDVRTFFQRMFKLILDDLPLAQFAGNILGTLSSGDKYVHLTDEMLKLFEQLANKHQNYIRESIYEELPWYVPEFIHNKVYDSIVEKIRERITEINSDPEHPMRKKFHQALDKFVCDLKTSPELKAQGEKIKLWMLANTNLKDYVGFVWDDALESIMNDLSKQDSVLRESLLSGICGLGKMLDSDPVIQSKINNIFETAIKKLALNHQDDLVALVSDTVNLWDSATLIEKLELQIGKDLQYIRLNGTLVGGLAGLVIYFISTLF